MCVFSVYTYMCMHSGPAVGAAEPQAALRPDGAAPSGRQEIICVYVCIMCICMCIYIYIYTHIQTLYHKLLYYNTI